MSDASSEGGQIARSAGMVGLLTLASRVLGLLRDAVIAAFYDKRATDAFFVAFTIPNVLRRLLAEGSLTVAFIPVFTEYRERHGPDEARTMVSNTLGAALLALLSVTALGVLFAPHVVKAFAYGFVADPEKLALATLLTRVMFAYLIAAGLTALAMGVLNTCGHFAAPAAAPVVLNLVVITAVLTATSTMVGWGLPSTMSLALGVVTGGGGQLLLQLPYLARHNALVLPRFDLRHPGVRRVAMLMLPSLFALAIYQINVMLARQFASFLPEGSISYLYYAQRLIEFPTGVFAVALATVAMPALSRHATAGDPERLKETYRYTLRLVFFVMLPATAGLLAIGEPLTAVLFQRGRFTHEMAQQTAWTLAGFSCGLWAAGTMRQTVQVFYALQDTRTPVKVSAVTLLVFAGLAWVLHQRLQTFGLALAVAVSSAVNFVLLTALLRRRMGRLGLRRVAGSVARAALASLPCGLAAYGVTRLGDWSLGGRAPLNYLWLVLAVAAGGCAYVLSARLLGSCELGELAQALRRRGR